MKVRIFSFLLFMWAVALSVQADSFTTLTWKNDTTRLGMSFPEAAYPTESPLPHYFYQYDLGEDYASRTYTVHVEYPEYQYVEIPSGLEAEVKQLPAEPLVQVRLQTYSYKAKLLVDLVPLVYRDGRLMRLTSFRLVMNESNVAKRSMVKGVSLTAEAPENSLYAAHSLLAEGRWVKVSVPYSGIFQFTDSKLKEMGFSNPAKVRVYGYGGALQAEDLKGSRPDDLCEVPAYRGNGRILFYGQGPVSWNANAAKTYFTRVQNFYATAGYYFLTDSQGESAAFPTEKVSATPSVSSPVTTFSEHMLSEDDSYNWATSGRELYEGYDYSNGNKKSYTFRLTGITSNKAYCTVTFAARSKTVTTVEVAANSATVGSFSIGAYSETYANYYKAVDATYNGSWTPTEADENMLITLTHTRTAGTPGRLNYITVNYRRNLKLAANYMAFRDLNSTGTVNYYAVSGCDASTQIWDVTTPGNYKQMQGTLSGTTYTFVGDNTTLREFVALNVNASYDTPSVVGEVPNQDLHALENPDMVIIVPASAKWLDQAERLAEAHRQKDNMKVHVVTAAQIYNEYSSGTPDATAYRWFMKMFYDRAGKDNWGSVYLLMMGDCSYDNRMLTSTWKKTDPNDFLLCYQSQNSTVEINSYVTDDYLGMLETGKGTSLSSEIMDLGVGRFPVRNWTEAKVAVDKTISYINNEELGAWKNRVCYAADDEESRKNNEFMIAAEKLASNTETNHPQFMVNRVYEDAFQRESTATGFTYPQATKRLLSLVDEGLLLLNYTGHGGSNGWSAEFLLTIQQIRAMRNSRLPLWVTATCDFCRYDDFGYSAGEEAFLNSKGGAVALFTTSRVVFSGSNNQLNIQFNNNIFNLVNGKRLRLGDIMRESKAHRDLQGDQNKLNFSLIGDPALRLGFPEHKVVLDSLNGKPVTASNLKLSAGDIITLKGHIEDASGFTATAFNGLVAPTVFDKKDHVVGYNHVGASQAFEFDQYNNKLFSGSNTVSNGHFQISFPVPLDISYSDEKGMINLYAASSEGVEAHGSFSNFTVGGTAPGALDTDSLGPEIYLYLNSPDFQAGGVVNTTPYLYAELTDEEGINTTGNGIGHDIVATIDNSPLYSYVLNDYFQIQAGGYSRGTVQYQFDALPEGKHTLYFTAWDTKNNSSTYQLPFRVAASAAPVVSELSCYPLPAVTDLTFHFKHNRPGTNLKLTIEVFTFSGSPVWEYAIDDQSSTGYYTYTWNLAVDGGMRLPEGIYLCRARFSTEGSEETTETLKIVVAAQ